MENKHYYTWTVPDTPSDIAQVRISEYGGNLESVSDPFFIAKDSSLFVVRPSSGDSVRAGSEYGLNWSAIGGISKVNLEYTLDGNKWVSIAKSVDSEGPHAWKVPNTKASNVRIRVSDSKGNLKSISDPFNIVK